MKFKQPSLGTKAVIFLPFLMSCTLTHFLMAELGCLASTPLDRRRDVFELAKLWRPKHTVWSNRLNYSVVLHFLKYNAFGMRCPSEWVGLQGSAQVSLLILLVMPSLLPAMVTQFPGCTQTPALAWRKERQNGQYEGLGQITALDWLTANTMINACFFYRSYQRQCGNWLCWTAVVGSD